MVIPNTSFILIFKLPREYTYRGLKKIIIIIIIIIITEQCIDDERQLKTAKRLQAPGDATVPKRFLHGSFRRRSKRKAFF